MPILMTIGAIAFFAGGLCFLGLLFSNGGWQRSRQFAVIGQLWTGQLGRSGKLLCRASLSVVTIGAMLCFAGVARMDGERADRCQNYCVADGYEGGEIGPSVDRSPASRFVACTCVSDTRPLKELRADAVKP